MPTDQHGLALTTASDAAARHFDEAINQYLGYKHEPAGHIGHRVFCTGRMRFPSPQPLIVTYPSSSSTLRDAPMLPELSVLQPSSLTHAFLRSPHVTTSSLAMYRSIREGRVCGFFSISR